MNYVSSKPENVAKAKQIIARAGAIDMRIYQSDDEDLARTEVEMHAKGKCGCMAGWIAVSPEFQADGGTCSDVGEPHFEVEKGSCFGVDAIAFWLGISEDLAQSIMSINRAPLLPDDAPSNLGMSQHYGKKVTEITRDDVLAELDRIV